MVVIFLMVSVFEASSFSMDLSFDSNSFTSLFEPPESLLLLDAAVSNAEAAFPFSALNMSVAVGRWVGLELRRREVEECCFYETI